MRTLKHQSPVRADRRDNWLVCDDVASWLDLPRKGEGNGGMRDGASWYGGATTDSAKRMARSGDMANVGAADKLLSQFEGEVLTSRRLVVVDDVAGGVPNVPAYLAGSPLAMRRRARVRDDAGLLGIVYDGTISGGMSEAKIRARGCAVLALVRLLSAVRPVELWFAAGLNTGRDGAFATVRLDTAPLDVARAAFFLTHPASARLLGYRALNAAFNAGGHWPYCGTALTAKDWSLCARAALPHLDDCLAIPGCAIDDQLARDPVSWVRDKLRVYGQQQEEAA
jgi:hypothetical protein